MMDLEQSVAEANRLLAEAGWARFPEWPSYCAGTLVAGIQSDGMAAHVKNWAAVQPGSALYSADTPDEPHEAAAWLVAFAKAREAVQDVGAAAVESVAFTEPGEAGVIAEAEDGLGSDDVVAEEFADAEPVSVGPGPEQSVSEPEDAGDFAAPAPDATLHAEVAEDPEPQAFAGTVFQFGDDLEARRSQRIGDVMRIALERTPAIDDSRLRELRNFAMGVAENRWADEPIKQEELAALETSARLASRLQSFARERAQALMLGDREYVDAFDPDSGWPD